MVSKNRTNTCSVELGHIFTVYKILLVGFKGRSLVYSHIHTEKVFIDTFNPTKGDVSDSQLNVGRVILARPPEINEGAP